MADTAVVFDITRTLRVGAAPFPGDPAFEKEGLVSGGTRISRLTMSSHAGTHLDAPAHVFAGGLTLDRYPVDRFVLTALVVDVRGVGRIGTNELAAKGIENVHAVLFKTQFDLVPHEEKPDCWALLAPEAAEHLVRAGISLVGTDAVSIDAGSDSCLPVHRVLLGADVLVLEDCDLSCVPEGRYELFCLPLRIEGADGAPCRAVLRTLSATEREVDGSAA